MKNYLRPYTMCTKVETEGYLLAGTGGGSAGSIKPAGSNSIKTKGINGNGSTCGSTMWKEGTKSFSPFKNNFSEAENE